MENTKSIRISAEVYEQFKHYCRHQGLQIKASTTELIKCVLTGSVVDSFMEPHLMRKEKEEYESS